MIKENLSAVEILGFDSIVVAAVDAGVDYPELVLKGINLAAEDLSVSLDGPSDALDLCRDIILDQAVGRNGQWDIQDGVLYVGFGGLTPEEVRSMDEEAES